MKHPHLRWRLGARLSGVTLIELLTVVAIVGVLSAVVWVAVSGRVKASAKQTQIKSDMRQVILAVNLYRADNDSGLPSDWKYFGYYGVNRAGWHNGSFYPRDTVYSKPPEYDVSYQTPECLSPPTAKMSFLPFRQSVERYEARRRLNPLDMDQTVATWFYPACDSKTIHDIRKVRMYRDGKEVAYDLRGIRSLSANLSGTISYQHEPDWVTELNLAN
jgi:prepilin-type N-terminal cleavage/methylation domain-containing protein